MNIALIIQARIQSERTPVKTLRMLQGIPLLQHVLLRLKDTIPPVKQIMIASSENSRILFEKTLADCFLQFEKKQQPIVRYYGDETNVLSRYAYLNDRYKPDILIRATGDNPLLSRRHIRSAIEQHVLHDAALTKYKNLPVGCAIEVIQAKALRDASLFSKEAHEFEHVTPYIYNHSDEYKVVILNAPAPFDRPDLRLTFDEELDYRALEQIFDHFAQKNRYPPPLDDVIAYLDSHPEVVALNRNIEQRKVRSVF